MLPGAIGESGELPELGERIDNLLQLRYLDEFRSFQYRISLMDKDGCYGPVGVGLYFIFHLHGFQHGDLLAFLHGLAFLDIDADDDSGKGRTDN